MIHDKKEQPSELWRWSATSLRDAIRSGELSATEVVTAHLERAQEVNGSINALISVSADEALATARSLDARPMDDREGPLFGVPVAIKDNTDQAGHPNTNGVVAAAGEIAKEDAALVAGLRAGGAVFVGRTNLPSFGMRWFSENELYGRTLNPWDPERTPGGSSGGGAAAVATGIVPIAHANDLGGSIRYPAAMCGVTGIRPTSGLISMWANPSLASARPSPGEAFMAAEGPIARHVADLRIGLEAMSTHDPRDPASLPISYRDQPGLPARPKVGIVRAIPGVETCPENLRALDDAMAWLVDAGYEPVEFDASEIAEASRLHMLLLSAEFHLAAPQMNEQGGAQLRQFLKHYFALAEETWGPSSLDQYIEGHTRRNEVLSLLESRLMDVPLVLTPPSAILVPKYGMDCGSFEQAAELVKAQWPMTFSAALGLPGVTVPTGVVNGLPGSVQVVGGRFRDSWILDAAQAIEDRAGVITPIDPITGS